MAINRLICPNCNCPLAPPSGQSTGVACPRCTTWLDIDPACLGSCLKCHKMQQAETTVCVDIKPANSDVGGCEKTSSNVVQRSGWASASVKHRSLAQTWKAVVSKVFHVR